MPQGVSSSVHPDSHDHQHLPEVEPISADAADVSKSEFSRHYDTRLSRLSLWRRIQMPVISSAVMGAIHALGPTLRYERLGWHNYTQAHERGEPVIAAFWHRCIVTATWYWRNGGAVVMNTAHFDGQWTRRVIEHFGFGTAVGSSTRGGWRGLAIMAEALNQGRDAAFTIDGPRGPRFVAKPGAVMLARRTGRPIYIFHYGISHAHTLTKAWDQMQVPYPWSRVVMVSAPLIYVPMDADSEELTRKQAEVQSTLEKVRDVAESWFTLTAGERERTRREWDLPKS
jgi:lysophospholipid acyltransferase (LPLAT)-like uncharacterized protein